jgi:hypothetical protein
MPVMFNPKKNPDMPQSSLNQYETHLFSTISPSILPQSPLGGSRRSGAPQWLSNCLRSPGFRGENPMFATAHRKIQWIGFRENLQESPIFNGKIDGFL